MSEKKVTVRLVMEGGKVVETELVGIGTKGKAALTSVSTAATDVGKSTGQMRSNVQNAAFQVQDFFVQVGAGTSVSRALGQQLPQLLGSLGLFGVIAGTAAAALIPLIGVLFKGEDQAAAFKTTIDELAVTMSALKAASAAADVSLPDLGKQYGQYAAQARELLEIQKQIAELNAGKAFAAAARSIPGVIDLGGGFAGKSSQELIVLAAKVNVAREEAERLSKALRDAYEGTSTLTDQQIREMEQRALDARQLIASNNDYVVSQRALAAAFGVSKEAASQLAVAAAQVREADSTTERLAAAEALAKAIWDSSDGLKDATPEAVELYDKLTDAWKAGLDLAALDIAGTIDRGADAALRLATNMRFAYGMMGRGQPVVATPGMNFPDYSGPDGLTRSPYGSIPSGLGLPPPPKVVDTTGSSGAGASAQNDALREAEKLFDETRTAAEKYSIEAAHLDDLFKTGAIDADLYQRAIAMIGEKYGEAADAGKFFAQVDEDLKSAFVDLAATGENSFQRIADAIKRAAIQALLFGEGPLGNMFGGEKSGGLLGGLFDGIFGGEPDAKTSMVKSPFGGGRAVGGPVSAGTTYLVGEAGPELFAPGRSGSIIPNHALRGAPAAGPTSLTVNVNVSGARGNAEIEKMVASGVQQGIAAYDKHALPSRVKQISDDPRRRG